ncbi:MAG: hypothetical protein PF542_05650 [Nanoarchaeota archaeon]|jgi:hypothetical protein|nr:hypothetical protein [Nanoarchaeota archaeon]
MSQWVGSMMSECYKCEYKSAKNKIFHERRLCEFCSYFAPDKKELFNIYVEEKTNWRDLQTYRKQGNLGGVKQKRGMVEKAKEGKVMSRAPFGYEIRKGKLFPAQNSEMVETIYEDFLATETSLNQLSKKYGISLNGLKKILMNFTYIGKIKFDGEVHEGKHNHLVSSTLFNHVQDKLEKMLRRRKINPKAHNNKN